CDISEYTALTSLPDIMDCETIIHLAAQAGVRHSLDAPFVYAQSNLAGHLSLLELARHSNNLKKFVYASSSSVYGANTTAPFKETDTVDAPVSLYAATKRSDELISEAYSRLFGIEQIGLRFFTVYGPRGRPDMAYWIFTEQLYANQPVTLFNDGNLKRDFTYIDDIAKGVIAVATGEFKRKREILHNIYNIGNNRPVELMAFLELLEKATGKKAIKDFAPMQPGDVYETCADITAISQDYGFAPLTSLEEGIPAFVDWFESYRR
ncbi:MAG: NAD-dependent epimerase/dehydratase family protein, partial [Pseudomonadota bacterium]